MMKDSRKELRRAKMYGKCYDISQALPKGKSMISDGGRRGIGAAPVVVESMSFRFKSSRA